jgi:hypothetical protein
MLLIIDTQYSENYAAHDWDGEGICPQGWKQKGGSSYKVSDVPTSCSLDDLHGLAIDALMYIDDYASVDVIGVRFEEDGWMSWYENSQMEYDGSIIFPEPTMTFRELLQKAAPSRALQKEMMESI